MEIRMNRWTEFTDTKDRNIGTFFRGLKVLWQMSGEHKKNIFVIFCLTIALNGFGISVNYVMKLIFDELAKKSAAGNLLILIAAYCVIRIIWALCDHFVKESRFIKTLVKLEHLWPQRVQAKMLSLSLQYHERENTGEKIEKIRRGCNRLAEVMNTVFWSILPEFVFMTINVVIVTAINWKLGLLFMAPIFPVVFIQWKMHLKNAPVWMSYIKKEEVAGGLFCQSIFNRCAVQGFAQEKKETEKFSGAQKEMEDMDIEINLDMQKYHFLISMILTSFLAATICLGCYFVLKGTATVGTVVYIAITGGYMSQNIRNIMNSYTRTLRYMVAVFRMKEVLDMEIDIKDAPDAVEPKNFKCRIALNHISYAYADKATPVLDDVSIRINPGEFVGIVGISGAGKTTLIRLLNRMYEADKGAIMLDNYNIRKLKLHWYRRLFAPVEQDVDIFDDTILANISYAKPDATQEDVLEAIYAAHLDVVLEDARRFPQGILTEVGERGVKLSGGERQRVGIARAYLALKNGAKILLLDEATSNLDSEAEKAIQEMIGHLRMKLQISVVAIAHRLSTIHKADRIYVLEDGKVIEEGNHSQLVAKGGRYQHLVTLQRLAND